MTQYKVDVIGEQGSDKDFDSIEEAFDHLSHLLENGKRVEVSVVPETPTDAPVEGEGAPTDTAVEGDDAFEPLTDPKDSLDDDGDDDSDEDDE